MFGKGCLVTLIYKLTHTKLNFVLVGALTGRLGQAQRPCTYLANAIYYLRVSVMQEV